MKTYTYETVYEIIARWAHDLLPYYADGWGRFPSGTNRVYIANALVRKAAMWHGLSPGMREAAQKLYRAAESIAANN